MDCRGSRRISVPNLARSTAFFENPRQMHAIISWNVVIRSYPCFSTTIYANPRSHYRLRSIERDGPAFLSITALHRRIRNTLSAGRTAAPRIQTIASSFETVSVSFSYEIYAIVQCANSIDNISVSHTYERGRVGCRRVLLSWSSSLSTRGIHTVHPPLFHDPQYYVINLEGSKPDATSQNGELEQIVYAPAVDAQVKEALVRVSHDK
jgi:hypothetical protein